MAGEGEMHNNRIWTELSEEITFVYDISSDVMLFSEKYKAIYKKRNKINHFLRDCKDRFMLAPNTVIQLEHLKSLVDNGEKKHYIQIQWPNKEKQYEWCELVFRHVVDDKGNVRAVGIWRNIDRQKRGQVVCQNMQTMGELEGIENRLSVEEQIAKELEKFVPGHCAALFFIDFDDVKAIQADFGVLAAEDLMHMFAKELLVHFYEDGIVGHMGSDKFLVFIRMIDNKETAKILAKRMQKLLKNLCEKMNLSRIVTACIGVSFITEKITYKEALAETDIALLHGKSNGRNQCVIYNENMRGEKYIRKAGNGKSEKNKKRYDAGKIWPDLLDRLYCNTNNRQGIMDSIAFIGNVFHLDKVMVWEYDDDDTISNTMQWAREGIPNTKDQQQKVPFRDEEISYVHNADGIFYCTSVENMPERMQQYANRECFQELLQSRIMGENGVCLGVIDFAVCKGGRVWVQEEIDFLMLMTQVIGEIIRRRHMSQKIEEYYNNTRNILDNVVTGIYVIDQNTYEIYYSNNAVTSAFPCFGYGAEKQEFIKCGKCRSCRLEQLMQTDLEKNNGGVTIHNDENGKDFEVKITKMLWENRKDALILTINEHIASPEELDRKRRQKYLEKRYAFIYSHSCDCIFDVDVEHDWYDVTVVKEGTQWAGLENHGNYTKMLEERIEYSVIGEDKQRLRNKFSLEALRESIAKGENMITDTIVVSSRKDTPHSKEIRAFILEEQDGRKCVVATYCDVTEERRRELQDLLERQKLTRAVVNVYPLVLSANVTQDNYVIMANEMSNYIIDKEPLKITTKALDLAIELHPEDRDRFIATFSRESLLAAFKDGKNELTMEVRYRYGDGTYHWIAIMVIRIDNPLNEDLLLYAFVRNIDRKKQMEQNLRDALNNAEQASLAKSDFLSRMSHEIRTPMNAIIGMTEIAKSKVDDPDSIANYLGKVDFSAQYLLSLINNILDMSRIESNKIVIENKEFNMQDLLNNIQNIIGPQAKERELNFYIEEKSNFQCNYLGDSLRINQILINLLSNALKYTDKGGTVTLSVKESRKEEKASYLCFTVADNGAGMSEEFLKNMYKPFEQEDATSAQGMQGTGLGLSITKNLISLMGGHIKCKSKKGEGTTFIIELKMDRVGDQGPVFATHPVLREKPDENALNQLVGKRILLAEDNELNQEIAVAMLEMSQIKVDCVGNGELVVQKFLEMGTFYYDMILMDIRMPNKNGLDATADIRAIRGDYAQDIPIVAMSANAFAEDKAKAFANGMTDYIVKPIDVDVLNEVLVKYLV